MEKTRKRPVISLTITDEVNKIGREKAKRENRSFSNYLEFLILKDNEK